jgi:ring-1,2-phenylacetyl-CoA epoxidase subunit PaaD
MAAVDAERPSVEQLWAWLGELEDPEIPVISIVDLGIVRDVSWQGGACVVTLTPTYSGCPATEVIAQSVLEHLHQRGVADVQLLTRLAPAWTTDWMTDEGKRKLLAYGIAPPIGLAREQTVRVADIGKPPPRAACPQCGSTRTVLTSAFGSTPCKSMYRCESCSEPFDHFKCH